MDRPALRNSREFMQRELEIGRRIQTSFLPATLPQPPGWEIASCFEPALMVSGDFYDAFMLSAGKRIGVVVGDVCDKGVGSAIYMALFRSLIHAFAEQHFSLGWMDMLSADRAEVDPLQAVGRRRALLSTGATPLKKAIDLTNRYITLNHGEACMFATVFFAVIDPTNGALMYINGGQNPPLIIGSRGVKEQLDPTGPVVGLLPEMEFQIGQAKLEPGETLLAYTDGVTDAHNPSGEFFGPQRLQALVEKSASSAEDILNRILAGLHEHINGADQYDDITLLAVRWVK
jgi:sigma-B regulation protein RsbU (phosphoserine phosphatase)